MPANIVSTGAIDTSPVVLTASDTLYPDDRKGALARIDNLPPGIPSADGIFYFNISGEYWRRVIDGPMSASYCGIYADGTDQTAKIAAAFSAGVLTIVFDNPKGGTYVVNGTLNVPAGRVLHFYSGNKLGGTGTVNKGIINADYGIQIFDVSLTVNPESVQDDKFSVRWFGAKGDNSAIDAIPIQAAIDLVVRNNAAFKTVWFPNGVYRIDTPLIVYRWDGTNYINHSVVLEGDGTFWTRDGVGPTIRTTDRQNFAIGIQNGKGCKVKGLRIDGGFVPPVTGTGYDFYSCSFEDFTDGVSRDNTYSPYAGIVIDPFTRSSTQRLDKDKYPACIPYYRGTGSQSGSTGTVIEDVIINNFVVGICSSPNGVTLNAELTFITKYRFSNVKLAISGGQHQEKMNKVQYAAGWSNVHTVFATGVYGQQGPGNWYIEELNLAGNVNRLMYNIQGGYFPTYIKKVFAESLGTFGTMNSLVGASVEDSSINFEYPENSKMIQFNIESSGVKFSNCNIRHYGAPNLMPVSIKGKCTFENVVFNAVPFIAPDQEGQAGTITFVNCSANQYLLGVANTLSMPASSPHFINASPYAPSGSFKTYAPTGYDANGRTGYIFRGDQIAVVVLLGTMAVSVSGPDRDIIITLPLADLFRVAIDSIVYYTANNLDRPVGVVKGIDYTTGVVTIKYASKDFVNGTYSLKVAHPLICGVPFIGDVTSGSNIISNVRIVDGTAFPPKGSWIKSTLHVTGSVTPYVRVMDWDLTAKTITVSSNAFFTAVGTFFCNEGTQYHQMDSLNAPLPVTRVLQKGSELSTVRAFGVDGVKQEYVVIKSGFLDPVAASDTRRAFYLPKTTFEYTGNPEGIVAFPSGAIARNINTGEIYLKTTTDNTQQNGGKNGWVKQRQQLFGTITTDTSVLVPTGDVAGKVVVMSTTNQSGLLIGTTPGGSELATISFTGGPNAGAAVPAVVLGTGTNSIYFTNVSGTVNYRIILE